MISRKVIIYRLCMVNLRGSIYSHMLWPGLKWSKKKTRVSYIQTVPHTEKLIAMPIHTIMDIMPM